MILNLLREQYVSDFYWNRITIIGGREFVQINNK